ncbi:MAG: transposase [Arcobacteraceae bacterium]|jgi:REP element-mobilizing transposase RayT|nr:transposase [Arcobacteraceae bacterium]
MARPTRIEKNGYYHVVNRGVAKVNIYLDTNDFFKFLEIVEEASIEYGFEVYSYALMSNHYHLLIKITNENLSIIMQKINSRYSIYFNHKYKRVGPLWQGRFKSWYVFDTRYLSTLVRYIEYNPIKAGIAKKIGEYSWAMSSKNVKFSMLNYELIEKITFDNELDANELEKINELYHAKFDIKEDMMIKRELKKLDFYFDNFKKDIAISKAIKDGYAQSTIAKFLKLSNVAVSKIYKIYKQKCRLFEKLRDKGVFWSYSKDMNYEECGEKLLIEYVLKYADFDDMKLCLELFGKRKLQLVWEEKLKSDRSFIKTNLMIARIFLGMDVEADYFKGVKNARFEKLKLLAS